MSRGAGSLESITYFIQDMIDNLAMNIWKVCPWRSRNRQWIYVLLQAYFTCVFAGFLLACVLNSVEGDKWINRSGRHNGGSSHYNLHAKGATALDECFWFVFTTMHNISFGEFQPFGSAGRIIGLACISIGYWFIIFLCCIVMFSQLPGEKTPSFLSSLWRMISACWPSYCVFCLIIFLTGSQVGEYLSSDHGFSNNDWLTGIYFMWQTAHRAPFGDLYPNTGFSRTLTIPMSMLGGIYMPYCVALTAVRAPTMAQHESLLNELRKHPEDSLGRGYVVPEELMAPSPNSLRQTEMQQLTASG